MLVFTIISMAYASVATLWRATNTTYVTSEHDDNFWADTYYGEASVRGADRGLNSDNRNVYYKWTKITYDVQGEIYSKTAYSNGKYDTNQVIERITVKDKQNIGPKTKAYYNYAAGIVDGSVGSFPGNEEVFYSGGLFVDGEAIEEGISFNKQP